MSVSKENASKAKETMETEAEDNSGNAGVSAEANEAGEATEQDKVIKLLYNTMLDNEVDEKYANQLLEEMENNKNHTLPMDHILANICQKMVLKFGKSE